MCLILISQFCRWKYIEDHTERSAWIATIVAAASLLLAVGVSYWLKQRMATQEANKKADGDIEKGEAGRFFSEMCCSLTADFMLVCTGYDCMVLKCTLKHTRQKIHMITSLHAICRQAELLLLTFVGRDQLQ